MRSIDVVLVGEPHRPAGDPLAAVREQEATVARAQGQRTRMLADLAITGEDNEFLPEELAAELGCSPVAARNKLEQARQLCQRLPETVDALCAGQIDWAKATALAEITRPLSAELAGEVEQWTLLRAANKPQAAFSACARRRVLRLDPDGAAERAAARRVERRVWLRPLEDGMAELGMTLPAEVATGAFQRIDHLARQTRFAGDSRGIDAARADVAADLLLGQRTGAGPSVRVNVTVDIVTLLGLRDEPAELHGYGPIDPATARNLATDATWRRLITDPETGLVLDIGRRSYRPPAALSDHIVLRDHTCVFPGCRRPAEADDLDHTQEWHHGGTTAADNLGALCRRHHRMKGESDWELSQSESGRFRWVSPQGKTYTTEPEPLHPPEPLPEPEPPPDQDEPPPF